MKAPELWYKNAIIYSLNVKTFKDSNGDGIGDFRGLTGCLDYLSSLGVTCIWLLPFFPSPERDFGYDVQDYLDIDPRLGNLGDFADFMYQTEQRGMRVIIDLVVNHTSIEHAWFQAARSDKNSPYRDYYVWKKDKPAKPTVEVIFPHEEDNIWAYDEKADAYYLHRYFKEQPDLNIINPAVREEIRKIMGFWLRMGVSGFRIDAAHTLIEAIALEQEDKLDAILHEMRDFLSMHNPEAVLLAEATGEPHELNVFFGKGDRMHMMFNFLLNQYQVLAMARADGNTLAKGFELLPEVPPIGQWVNFLRHHDELNLENLSEGQQQEVFKVFGPEENMQIFGRGIRRRMAPILQNNRPWLEMAYSLLFSLPGAPLIRYGEEIGMGDDLSLEGRNSVRTTMQWSAGANGGFSSAPEKALYRPALATGTYGYKKLNVSAQLPDPDSLLSWVSRLIRIRKLCPEIGWGKYQIHKTNAPSVFAHSYNWDGNETLVVHNLSEQPVTVKIDGSPFDPDCTAAIFSDQTYEAPEQTKDKLTLSLKGHGFRWFRINSNRDLTFY
jgi:maltose alpha-D-glucosyltransferase / alpha-amylase